MEQLWPGVFLINHHTVLENVFVVLWSCIVDVSFGCFLIHSDFPASGLGFFVLFVCLFEGFQSY